MAMRLSLEEDRVEETHEINVTPFIDVILVLLIIFMVAAPLSTVDLKVDLPASTAQPAPRPDKPVFVTVKADLSLALGDDPVSRETLAAALDAATRNDKEQRIFVRADRKVAYGDVMEMMNLLRAAGYLKIGLVGMEETAPTGGAAPAKPLEAEALGAEAVTTAGMVSSTSANGMANMVANSILPVDDAPSLRRWLFATVAVVLVHAAIVLWILYVRDFRSAGEPPAVVMIDLAPLDVAPPSETPPDVTPGPQMTEAEPEAVEQPQVIPVPELAPAPKPDVVLMPPPKPKPKPKKIVKEIPKPVVKPTHEPPAPRTSAPPRAAAASRRPPHMRVRRRFPRGAAPGPRL